MIDPKRAMPLRRGSTLLAGAASLALALAAGLVAQPAGDAGKQAVAEGDRLWRLKQTRSALAAYEKVAAGKSAEAQALAYARIGRIYLFKGAESEGAFPGWHEQVAFKEKALRAFDEALKRAPTLPEARAGRFKTLKALGRDPGPEPAMGPPEDATAAAQIQDLRAAKKYAELVEPAMGFVARYPQSESLPRVYDALIEAYAATPATSVDTLGAAIDARIAAQPDPGAYVSGANLLLGRGALDPAAKLAQGLVKAADTFISENFDSYKLAEKANGSLVRARGTSADLLGWVLFQKGDQPGAEARLREADRLLRGQDFMNQFHLAEVMRKKGDAKEARERYLNALTLAAGPEPQRAAARKALAQLDPSAPQDAAAFEAQLAADLVRRRGERKAQLLQSMLDRVVPNLPLMDLSGQPLDLSKLRGKVRLYKFFASW